MINKQHFAALLCLLVSGFVPALTPHLAQQPRYPDYRGAGSVERFGNASALTTRPGPSRERLDQPTCRSREK